MQLAFRNPIVGKCDAGAGQRVTIGLSQTIHLTHKPPLKSSATFRASAAHAPMTRGTLSKYVGELFGTWKMTGKPLQPFSGPFTGLMRSVSCRGVPPNGDNIAKVLLIAENP